MKKFNEQMINNAENYSRSFESLLYTSFLIASVIMACSVPVSAQAVILSDSSIRTTRPHGSNYQIADSSSKHNSSNGYNDGGLYSSTANHYSNTSTNTSTTYASHTGTNRIGINRIGSIDRLGSLIQKKNKEYEKNAQAFYQSQTQAYQVYNDYNEPSSSWQAIPSFENWLNNYYNRQRATEYQTYLQKRLGKRQVPPMSQMLLTARSWSKCGAEPYEVPPSYLWNNMIPTLQLLAELKRQGVIPADTVIRSVYRNPQLNNCAKGSSGSKHRMNAAMDLWVPSFDYDAWQKHEVQNKLCDFWLYQGARYNFGLGLYSTGSIHIDTQGHRKWGGNHSATSSPCRY